MCDMKKLRMMTVLGLCLCLMVSVAGCGAQSPSTMQTTVPETTVPETTVPETTVPETTVPETTIPETAGETADLVATDTAGGLARVYLPEEVQVMTDEKYAENGWQIAAQSDDVLILGAREDRAMFEANDTEFPENMLEYIIFLSTINEFPDDFYSTPEGRFYTTYQSTVNGEPKFFYLLLAQGEDAFWMVHFLCDAEDAEAYLPQFELWGSAMELK